MYSTTTTEEAPVPDLGPHTSSVPTLRMDPLFF